MSEADITQLDSFSAPYGREVKLEDVRYDSGMRLLRIRIREGRRFTVMDIDAATASHWAGLMQAWADSAD